jgi:hypothetical protein
MIAPPSLKDEMVKVCGCIALNSTVDLLTDDCRAIARKDEVVRRAVLTALNRPIDLLTDDCRASAARMR